MIKMAAIKDERPETFTLLNLLEQDVFEINHIATKIEAELDETSKHIHSMLNLMYSLNDEEKKMQEMVNVSENTKIQDMVNVFSSCFHMVENDLSTLKFHANRIEERRNGIVVCLSKVLYPECDEIKQEPTDVESIWYAENLQNKYVSGNDTIDQDNSDTDEYELENISSFIDGIETGKDYKSLEDENSTDTNQDSNDNSPKNKLQVGPSPNSTERILDQCEIQGINKAGERCSNEKSKVVIEDKRNVSCSGGLEKKHMTEMHSNEEIEFKCENSETTFNTRIKLKKRRHREGLTGKDEKHLKFPCKLCKKVLSSKTHFKRHVEIFCSKVKRPYKCKDCEKSFYESSALHTHVKSHGDKLYQCPHCPSKYTVKASLVQHINKHTGKNPFLCEECGRGFLSHKALSSHISYKHICERRFKCDKCEAAYIERSKLKQHVKMNHPEKNEQISTFICDVCAASFKTATRLKTHSLIHSGIRAHKCPNCPKDFISSDHLMRHIVIHTGQKPFKCEDCGKCFTQRTNLQVHRRCHTGEKPYVCECGKAFAHRVSLNSHRKSMGGTCKGLAKVNP